MGNIKDNLDLEKNQVQTVTLSFAELAYLRDMHSSFQRQLEILQQMQAAKFLQWVAVNRFEYDVNDDLRFNLDIKKNRHNLEITKVADK